MGVSKEQKRIAPITELQDLTSEAISLLVDEAQHGLVSPQTVVSQLQEKNMTLYLFFYVSSLWKGDGIEEHQGESREKLVAESKSLVDDLADLAVHLFAMYDRELLMEFLKSSTFYTFEKATQECEEKDYIPELVYLYSKTGQTKRALTLIIDRLRDVSQAVAFAKSQDDTELWNDLLDYSMDKPRFIRGLLEEVGTAINPITLVRRIPEGLEIEGLREGLSRMIKEYEIQHSISSGVARVLRGEVATAQTTLRAGQRKGVKFDIVRKPNHHIDVETSDIPTNTDGAAASEVAKEFTENATDPAPPEPGHCVGCHQPFSDHEVETLVGFGGAELTSWMYWWGVPILQFFWASFLLDTWQYGWHRYFHTNKFLYRHIHSWHHRLYCPYAYGALYNHPAEGFVLDSLGTVFAHAGSFMTTRQAILLFSITTWKTCDDHCGFALPWDPAQFLFRNNVAYHDIHHQQFGIKKNFSQPYFTHWDVILNTRMTPEQVPMKNRLRYKAGPCALVQTKDGEILATPPVVTVSAEKVAAGKQE